MIYYPTVMARYSLFVLKVPLNPKQTNKQTKQTNSLHRLVIVMMVVVVVIVVTVAGGCSGGDHRVCWWW